MTFLLMNANSYVDPKRNGGNHARTGAHSAPPSNTGRRPTCPEPEPHVRARLPRSAAVRDRLDEWWRIAPELHRLGLLTVIDVVPLAAYVIAYGRWRTAEELLARAAEADAMTRGMLVRRPLATRVGTRW